MSDDTATGQHKPSQNVFKVRRDYNTWVANESIEDYALRFTPRSYRKWTEWQVANTAFSSASFLVLEAIGATLMVEDGFVNAASAIAIAGLIIFLVSLPISRYSARYGLDMDLLTRGAGFGYLGSTITSLIYAAFTFIFFALEASIMASALQLAFGIPLTWGYLICALVVIPLVMRGITLISRLQIITQPLWLLLLLMPYVYLFTLPHGELAGLFNYGGYAHSNSGFDLRRFGAGLTVVMSIIAQMGEQADYLRFMPEIADGNRHKWWLSVTTGGTLWLALSVLKMMGGTVLAYLILRHFMLPEQATDPNQMYLMLYRNIFNHASWAVALTALFVVISQLKINVTNAYAGSLAWSNFFSRLTHSHPGRVVWLIFNTLIALMLMELGLLQAMARVLGLYSNIATAWIMTVVADLVINKTVGWSPTGVEFRRAYLYDINPVGAGAMALTCAIAVSVYLGIFGRHIQPYAIFFSIGLPWVLAPAIAWATQGRYYIARTAGTMLGGDAKGMHACCICGTAFEADDMAHCPAYQDNICSLCCTLDARCHDMCKPDTRWLSKWLRWMPASFKPYFDAGLGYFLLMMLGFVILITTMMGLLYYQESLALFDPVMLWHLQNVFLRISAALILVSGIITWWMALAFKSRQVAQTEANHQTQLLMQEIDSHRRTDAMLQHAKQIADHANQAKSRYVMSISHELRTPLNSIMGYAQMLDGDDRIPVERRQAIRVIRRSGEHLLSLIEGSLDLARIESGKLSLDVKPIDFIDFVQQIISMFELQAHNKGIAFSYQPTGDVPAVVRADAGRLRQILINVLGNAVKFTQQGGIIFRLKYQSELVNFEIEDTGPGMAEDELVRIFEPFLRGHATSTRSSAGTGLGLTIAKMLTDLMGGELTVNSQLGVGSQFRIRLYLPHVHPISVEQPSPKERRIGYVGKRIKIMVVDDEPLHRELLVNLLQPMGFELVQADTGDHALIAIAQVKPDIIFLDVNMPGNSGWETLRIIREQHLTNAVVAMMSANSFDQDMGATLGIDRSRFISKPINIDALLRWIQQQLGFAWLTESSLVKGEAVTNETAALHIPPIDCLTVLNEQIELGYVRGIRQELSHLQQLNPHYAPFVSKMLALAERYQFHAMQQLLKPHE